MSDTARNKILFIEDNLILATAESEAINQSGYDVLIAASGEEAIVRVKTDRSIDLVLIDIALDGRIDGAEAARQILAFRDIPVVFLTSHTEQELVEKTCGITHYGYVLKNSCDIVLKSSIKMAFDLFEANNRGGRLEDRLRTLSDYISKSFAYCRIILDKEGRPEDFECIEVNDSFERLSGIKKEDITGKRVTEVIPGIKEIHPELFAICGTAALTGTPASFEMEFKPHARWLSIEVYQREYGYFVTLFEDITERRKVEHALRESEENFRNFVDSADVIFIVGSLDGKIIYANRVTTSKLRYRPEELVNMSILDLYPAESRNEAEDIIMKMIKGELDVCPLPVQRKDGGLIPVETRVWPGRWNGENCLFGISKDLSKEQEALQKFNKLFSRNPSLMAVNSQADGRFIDINDAFLHTLGYSREEVIGRTSTELGLFIQPEMQKKAQEQISGTGRLVDHELKVRCRDGRVLDGIFCGETIENHSIKSFLTVMVDITERKKTEEALKRVNERFELAQTAAGVGVWDGDSATNQIEWTPQMFSLFGLDPHLTSISFDTFKSFVHPEDRETARCEIQQSLKERIPLFQEYRIVWPDSQVRWIQAQGKGIYDNEGRPLRMLGICLDITERKLAEERITSLLREKELLLKEVHHRIKNNIITIMSLLTMHSKRLDNPKAIEALMDARSRMQSMGVMYQKLYCSDNFIEMSIIDYLPPLINEVADQFPNRDMVTIKNDVADFPLNTRILSPLGMIAYEIISNTMKYAFTGRSEGVIHVSASLKDKHATLVFEDNGNGIPESIDIANSTGFGLQLVSILAEQLDGSIRLERQEGTKFILEFEI